MHESFTEGQTKCCESRHLFMEEAAEGAYLILVLIFNYLEQNSTALSCRNQTTSALLQSALSSAGLPLVQC